MSFVLEPLFDVDVVSVLLQKLVALRIANSPRIMGLRCYLPPEEFRKINQVDERGSAFGGGCGC